MSESIPRRTRNHQLLLLFCQIEWTSEGLDTPVTINLLGPESAPEEAVRDSYDNPANVEGDDDEGNERDDEVDEEYGNDMALIGAERSLRPAAQLGSGLPTAGSFLAHLDPALDPALGRASSRPQQADVPPGDGYRIEVSPPPGQSLFAILVTSPLRSRVLCKRAPVEVLAAAFRRESKRLRTGWNMSSIVHLRIRADPRHSQRCHRAAAARLKTRNQRVFTGYTC